MKYFEDIYPYEDPEAANIIFREVVDINIDIDLPPHVSTLGILLQNP